MDNKTPELEPAERPSAQTQPQAQQHSNGQKWRVLVVAVGLGVGGMTDGPKQRVAELCSHEFGQGGWFCSMEEQARTNTALILAACFFLADCIWCALAATPLWARAGKDALVWGLGTVYTELRRCWRRRRKRQAREKEKRERQNSREAALQADRRIKRLAELEMAATRQAMRSKQTSVRRRSGLAIQKQKQKQREDEHAWVPARAQKPDESHQVCPHPPGVGEKQHTLNLDVQHVEQPSGLAAVAERDCHSQSDDTLSVDLSVDGSETGSDNSKVSTDSCTSDKSRGTTDEAQAQVVVEGVSHKLVVLLLIIIGIIGMAMVLETLQLAKQNREWSGTVDRAVGTDLIINVAKAMHETQKERGMTAIHVGSGGTELLFELGQQHVASDSAVTVMVDALSRHISEHATHLRSTNAANLAADDETSWSNGGYENTEVVPFHPPSLAREQSGFDNAVREVLAFVAELPKRRQRHIPRSVFLDRESLLSNANLPAVDPTAAASAAGSDCGDHSDCKSLSSADELDSMIGFYTAMHQSLITLATEMCTDFMTGVVPGKSNQLAPALFAFINLMVLKEKAGIERAIVSGQIALHASTAAANVEVGADPATSSDTNVPQAQAHLRQPEILADNESQQLQDEAEAPPNMQARIPLATMVRLREVIAQQEGYRRTFFRFAPKWAADAYRSHRKEDCVVESLRMRAVLLRPLRKLLGISIVEEDTDWSQVAHGVVQDDYSTEEVQAEASLITAVDWFSNQTCRLDSLDSLSRKLSWAIEADAKSSRHDAEHRLVWLVTPLGVSFALTMVVALHAMRTFCVFQAAAQARVASLTERQTMYKTLAERWAPLSLAADSSLLAPKAPEGTET